MARPSDFTQETADLICALLLEGESLRSICAMDGMPDKATVFRWLAAKPAFRDQYAKAKEDQAEALADEIVAIADDQDEDVQRSRLRVDARKWVAAKLLPKKYGERGSLELTGKDGGPIETKDLSDLDVARRLAFLLTSPET